MRAINPFAERDRQDCGSEVIERPASVVKESLWKIAQVHVRTGYSLPGMNRSKAARLFFYVNESFLKDKLVMKVLTEAHGETVRCVVCNGKDV